MTEAQRKYHREYMRDYRQGLTRGPGPWLAALVEWQGHAYISEVADLMQVQRWQAVKTVRAAVRRGLVSYDGVAVRAAA